MHSNEIPIDMVVTKLQLLEARYIKTIGKQKFKKDWRLNVSFTRFIGDTFCKEINFAILKVPTAVLNRKCNFLLNPLHQHLTKLTMVSSKVF